MPTSPFNARRSVVNDFDIVEVRLLNRSSSCRSTTEVGEIASPPNFFQTFVVSYWGGIRFKISAAVLSMYSSRLIPPLASPRNTHDLSFRILSCQLNVSHLIEVVIQSVVPTYHVPISCNSRSQHSDEDRILRGCWSTVRTRCTLRNEIKREDSCNCQQWREKW